MDSLGFWAGKGASGKHRTEVIEGYVLILRADESKWLDSGEQFPRGRGVSEAAQLR